MDSAENPVSRTFVCRTSVRRKHKHHFWEKAMTGKKKIKPFVVIEAGKIPDSLVKKAGFRTKQALIDYWLPFWLEDLSGDIDDEKRTNYEEGEQEEKINYIRSEEWPFVKRKK